MLGKRLLLVGVSLAVSVGLSELALRVAWHNPFRTERPDHVVTLRKHHGLRDIPVDRSAIDPDRPLTRFRTDARSYALPSFQYAEPDLTVAFLGGSTTQCNAVSEDQRFHALVSDLLGERGLRVNTLNAARSGNTAHDSLNVLLNHVVRDEPDVVVMMHAANDLGVLVRSGSYAPRMGGPAGFGTAARWLGQEASARSALVGALRWWATIRPLAGGDFGHWAERLDESELAPTSPFEARLRAFVGIARGFGAEPVLMTQPASNVWTAQTPPWLDLSNQARFNDAVRAVASAQRATLIDLARHVVEHVEGWDRPMRVFYDGVHVTDAGSRIYAEHIAERLYESVITRRPAQSRAGRLVRRGAGGRGRTRYGVGSKTTPAPAP